MNTQRKRYQAAIDGSLALEDAEIVGLMNFVDAPAVNIHGVNISIGVAPVDPEEVMRGRWYVCILPRSIAEDNTLRNSWVDQLNTVAAANDAIDGSTMIWGSGSFVASDATPFNTTFSPRTSRNVQMQGQLIVVVVADTISGLLDEWEAVSGISLFTSS